MFHYAVTGCDTVSAIYRQGSRKTFNMVHKKLYYDLLDTFAVEAPMMRYKKSRESLYGASSLEYLGDYRHTAYN